MNRCAENQHLTHEEDVKRFLSAIGEVKGWVLTGPSTLRWVHGLSNTARELWVIPPYGVTDIRPLVNAIDNKYGYRAMYAYPSNAKISGYGKQSMKLHLDLTNRQANQPLKTVEKYGAVFETIGSQCIRQTLLPYGKLHVQQMIVIIYLLQKFSDAFTDEECKAIFNWFLSFRGIPSDLEVNVVRDGMPCTWNVTYASAVDAFYHLWQSKPSPYGEICDQNFIRRRKEKLHP